MGARQHQLDAQRRLQAGAGGIGVGTGGQVDRGERAQSAVVHHIGVGDGQDDSGGGGTQPGVEPVLQVDHIRLAVHAHLGVHAVVSGEGDHAAHCVKLSQVAVHHGVEGVGAGGAGRVLVLDVVGGGQVHHIGAALLHQLDAGGKDKLGQVGAVDAGQGLAHQRQHVVDTVVFDRGLVGFFGREADASHLVPEQGAQFVLGCHHRQRQAGIGQCRQQGGRAQPFGVIHHDLHVVGHVVQVVAANAMHAGWHAGHDGQVVGVGEGGHHAVGHQRGTVGQRSLQPGHLAICYSLGQVVGLAPVDADHHGGRAWQLVGSAVDMDGGGRA